MSSSPTKTTFIRRIAFAAAPLVVLLLVWPATRAHADILSVFTDLFNTVTSTLGGPSSAIDGASSQQLQFLTNTIYPQSNRPVALVDLYNEHHIPAMDDERDGASYKQRHRSQLSPIGVCHARRIECAAVSIADIIPNHIWLTRYGQGSCNVYANRD